MMIEVEKVKLFIDRLIEKIIRMKSHICVGLDPHLNLLPSFLIRKARNEIGAGKEALSKAIFSFNQKIIDQIADIAVAVKPQIAFYEQLGAPGMITLKKTISYARRQDLIVILDAKRNDIGSTARAYATAYLGNCMEGVDLNVEKFQDDVVADAMTVNPYLGFDGIKPFIISKDKGAFALVRTSNSSGKEIQDLKLDDGDKLYQKIGELVSEWGSDVRGKNGYSNLGAVVGATYPGELKILREKMPHSYFLIPGYGAQGGKPEDVIHGFNEDNLGAIINSARGIIFAYQRAPFKNRYSETEFAQAAGEAAREMRDKINEVLY